MVYSERHSQFTVIIVSFGLGRNLNQIVIGIANCHHELVSEDRGQLSPSDFLCFHVWLCMFPCLLCSCLCQAKGVAVGMECPLWIVLFSLILIFFIHLPFLRRVHIFQVFGLSGSLSTMFQGSTWITELSAQALLEPNKWILTKLNNTVVLVYTY